MLIVSYDIVDDKLRTRFSKFLGKFGFRLQYSVFQIKNSDRILHNIVTEIENTYKTRFTESDSVIIFELGATCKKTCYGHTKNNDEELVMVV